MECAAVKRVRQAEKAARTLTLCGSVEGREMWSREHTARIWWPTSSIVDGPEKGLPEGMRRMKLFIFTHHGSFGLLMGLFSSFFS